MEIQDIARKYDLSKEANVDFWKHQQSGQWILTHNAVEKIANKEGVELIDINVLNSEMDLVRILITMKLGEKTITSVGEADRNNCRSQYLGCMAEKRGTDRCVLKLINAYEYGISSEVEADDFARPNYYQKTDNELEKFDNMLQHPYFKGKKADIKTRWKEIQSKSQTDMFLRQMSERIKQHEESRNVDSVEKAGELAIEAIKGIS